MRDNYFEPSFGNRPRNLVGRESHLRKFEMALESKPASRDRAMLVLGQRGYGKTVLLLEMADIARERGFIVASPTVVAPGMLERIIEKLNYEAAPYLKKEKAKVTGGNVSVLGFGAGVQFQEQGDETRSFAFRLSALCRELDKKDCGVLILIDEVQANNEELKQLIIAYQEIVGEGGNIAVVIAGLPGAISTTLNEKVLTFLNRASKSELTPLNEKDIYAYYKNTFKKIGIGITDDMCRDAASETDGSPYMMQLLGHYIVSYCDEGGTCDEKTYAEALSDSRIDYINDIAKTTINTLSAKDVEFLTAMLPDDDTSRISDISERMGVSSAYAQLYKRRLVDAGVIEKAGRGEVRMTMPSIRDYLKMQE